MKRFLAIVLSACLLLSVASFDVFAATTSGTLESGVKWSFNDSTGELKVTGSGATGSNTVGDAKIFFEDFRNKIKKITIGEGITEISEYFFSNLSVETVSFPSTLTTIGEYAFWGLHTTQQFLLPSNLRKIDEMAFMYLNGVDTLTIPAGVTSIEFYAFNGTDVKTIVFEDGGKAVLGASAFSGGNSLTEVKLGTAAPSFNSNPFNDSAELKSFSVSADNKLYTAADGVLYSKDKTKLLAYPMNKGTSFTVPSNVRIIGNSAFRCSKNLESVKISEGVTEIQNGAFAYCNKLAEINFPSTIDTIGDSMVFEQNKWMDELPDGLFYIGKFAYKYVGKCPEKVTVKSGTEEINSYCFYNQSTLKQISLPDSLKTIGNDAFSETGLTSVKIPDSVTKLGSSAFYQCEDLESITLSRSLKTVDSFAVSWNDKLKKLVIPDGVELLDEFALFALPNTLVYVPASVTTIKYAAVGCYNPDGKAVINVPNYRVKGFKDSKIEAYCESCGFTFEEITNDDNPYLPPTTVTLKSNKASLYISGTCGIKATVENPVGKTTYTCSDTKVAKVSSTGTVRAIKAGKAYITVSNNGVSKRFAVTVKSPKLNKTKITLKKNKTFALKITGKVGNATFKTSNKKVAKVSSKGSVRAIKKGKARITVVTNGKVKLSCVVTVA